MRSASIVGSGLYSTILHYEENHKKIDPGDLVVCDIGAEYSLYTADITRTFPASGKFTPRQREFYSVYLRLYQDLMTSIKVHVRPSDIIKDAVAKMDAAMAAFPFTDEKIKQAATAFVQRYRNSRANGLGHNVGMEVHDVRSLTGTLEPGQIFTIEPAMQIPDEHIGIRLEDMLLITEMGYENLSGFVPVEIADIEKMMGKHGLSDAQVNFRDQK